MNPLLACLLFGASSLAAPTATEVPPTFLDVRYGPHERHTLDVWQAKADAPTPLVIYIHGGGWSGGEKTDIPAKQVSSMLQHGISVASVNYRFTNMAIMPAPLHDAARAVQFLRSKSGEWNFDAQRFGGYGISVGACSVVSLAFHDEQAATHPTPEPEAFLLEHLSRK